MIRKETPLWVRKVAILGAGVMGAQIAAHFVNAGIQTFLFDLASKEEDGEGSQMAKRSIAALAKLKPNPIAHEKLLNAIIPANYETHLSWLAQADLIIEAISERLDWKKNLYTQIAPFIRADAILVSNTSGLSIQQLSDILPFTLQPHFLGMHFFNPPRYMKLVELIPHSQTDSGLTDKVESFLTSRLGKEVVYAKDTPNFIGNRIGVFSLLTVLHHAEQFSLPPDVVDNLTGLLIGRPTSATFRTLDVIGLDTFIHVVNTLKQSLTDDPWAAYFSVPTWLIGLVEKGKLGQKTQAGIYIKNIKTKHDLRVFDPIEENYRPVDKKVNPELAAILHIIDPMIRMRALYESPLKEAKFLWYCYRDVLHYVAYHLTTIAHTVSDIDRCMRYGFGWAQGPFEIWQACGLAQVTDFILSDIQALQSMVRVGLPDWVTKLTAGNRQLYLSVDNDKDKKLAFSPETETYLSTSTLPIYLRQSVSEGRTIFETEELRLWDIPSSDRIAIVSFKTKKHTITYTLQIDFLKALETAQQTHQALIIWQPTGQEFSYGADLKKILEHADLGNTEAIAQAIDSFQLLAQSIRYSPIPVIAAIRGFGLWGGCEIALACAARITTFETYLGLVETRVGLIPGGGGCLALVRKAAEYAGQSPHDLLYWVDHFYWQVYQAEVSTSSLDAKRKHYLGEREPVIMQANELLFAARQYAACLIDTNYTPPMPTAFQVVGIEGFANIEAKLIKMRDDGIISEYDYTLGVALATVMCGGKVIENTQVKDEEILSLEKIHFLGLLSNKQTRDRIKHTLKMAKSLKK